MSAIIYKMILSFLNSPFISAATGGVIGGLFTYLGVKKTLLNQEESNRIFEQTEADAFCKAIATELESILTRYLSSVGNHLGQHPTDQPFMSFYSVTEEYFTVFNSNAHLIGKVKDDELRSAIVRIYTFTKGHLDSLRMNNAMLANVQALAPAGIVRRDDPQFIKYQTAMLQLTSYAPTLVKSHADLIIGLEETLRKLKAQQS